MGKKFMEKFEGAVSSMRESLEKNDGSTIQAVWNNLRGGLGSIKGRFSESERAKTLLNDIKKLGEDLAAAIKAGDKKLSAKILDTLEKKIKEYRKEEAEEAEDKKEEKDDSPKLEA